MNCSLQVPQEAFILVSMTGLSAHVLEMQLSFETPGPCMVALHYVEWY